MFFMLPENSFIFHEAKYPQYLKENCRSPSQMAYTQTPKKCTTEIFRIFFLGFVSGDKLLMHNWLLTRKLAENTKLLKCDLWLCANGMGFKIYKKYYLVRIRGGHIRQVGLTTGGLSSQGPLYFHSFQWSSANWLYISTGDVD